MPDMPNRKELVDINKDFDKVRKQVEKELMAFPGVLAVGVGVRERGGKLEPEICFKVTVQKKIAGAKLKKKDRLPKTIMGFPVDVEETTVDTADVMDPNKYRPLIGGCQITVTNSNTATLGALATLDANGAIVGLTNYHVMVTSHATGPNGERAGQPTHNGCCSCCACNEIGTLIAASYANQVDCAIIQLSGQTPPGDVVPDDRYLNEILEIGHVAGDTTAVAGETVYKRGANLRFVEGTITNDNFPVTVSAYGANHNKVNQLNISPTAAYPAWRAGGDSGSVILNEHNQIIGLHMSGNGPAGRGNRIEHVKTALSISFPDSSDANGVPMSTYSGVLREERNSILAQLSLLQQSLNESHDGTLLLQLFDKHQEEVMQLIRTERPVKVAWNRYKGPAFIVHFMKMVKGEAEDLPEQIQGISFMNLMLKMAAVLTEHGSDGLCTDILLHQSLLLNKAADQDWWKQYMSHGITT